MYKAEIQVYPEYFKHYLSLVKETNLLAAMKERTDNILGFYMSIPDEKWDYSYAEGKWSIKKMVRHIIDSELVFLYRAMSIARGEKQALLGFDESSYAEHIDESVLTKDILLNSLTIQALYTYDFFKYMSKDDFLKVGNANRSYVSVGAIGYAIVGHDYHHRIKLNELYI